MKSVISIVFIASAIAACGVAESSSPRPEQGPPADGGAASTPEVPQTPPAEAEPPDEPDEPDEPETGFEECATQYDEATLKPLDMVLMLDRSGSMLDDGKWQAATTAIQQFAASPDSTGIGVSLSYFPQTYSNLCLPCTSSCGVCFNGCCALPTGDFCWDDGDCDSGGLCYSFMCYAGGGNATCDAADYATPQVPLASLPAAAGQLNISMLNTSPAGGTPTGPALHGALSYAATVAAQAEANDVVVVLATDGEPTECQPQGIGEVASLAADAAAAAEPISTFVIGVGTSIFNLNAIAAAGGTTQAYLVDANANATQSFLDALNDIRRVAVACQYTIPQVSGTIAYNLVNVAFSTQDQPLTPVANVTDASACGISGGWHYDDPNAPSAIVMCPSTCEQFQDSEETKVEIVYGCETLH